jgi:hypothetical protein
VTQRVFGPDQRGGKWYFYAYVDGQQVEWGPYSSEEFARGAADAIERRMSGGPVGREAEKPREIT